MAVGAVSNSTEVRKLLADLMGRAVTVKDLPPVPATALSKAVLAVYRTADGAIGALAVADIALAANLAAALVMIPAGVAADSVRAGKLSESLLENAREVFNVSAQLVRLAHIPTLALREVLQTPPLPPDVAAFAKAPSARLDVEVAVAGYTAGKLTLLR